MLSICYHSFTGSFKRNLAQKCQKTVANFILPFSPHLASPVYPQSFGLIQNIDDCNLKRSIYRSYVTKPTGITKKKKSTKLSKKASSKPKNEEDLDDDEYDESYGDGSPEAVAQAMRNSPESLRPNSSQIEQMLRSFYPPDVAEQAITEHRKVFPKLVQEMERVEQLKKSGQSDAQMDWSRVSEGLTPEMMQKTGFSPFGMPIPSMELPPRPNQGNQRLIFQETPEGQLQMDAKQYFDQYESESKEEPRMSASASGVNQDIKKAVHEQIKAKLEANKGNPPRRHPEPPVKIDRSKAKNITELELKYLREKENKVEQQNSNWKDDLIKQEQQKHQRESSQSSSNTLSKSASSSSSNPSAKTTKTQIENSQIPFIAGETALQREARILRMKKIMSGESIGNPVTSNPFGEKATAGKSVSSPITAASTRVSALVGESKRLQAEGKWRDAANVVEEACKLSTDYAHMAEFSFQAHLANQHSMAKECSSKAYPFFTKDPRLNYVIAASLVETSRNMDQAEKDANLKVATNHLAVSLESNPNIPDYIGLRGLIRVETGQHIKAKKDLKEAILSLSQLKTSGLKRQAPFFIGLGICYASEDKYDLAETQFNLAHKADPSNIRAMALIGELYEKVKVDIPTAIQWYEKCVETDPNDVASLVRLGQILSDPDNENPDLKFSLKCFQRALMIEPSHEFWFPIGWITMQLGQNETAIQFLQKAAENDPDEIRRWTALVMLAEIHAFDPNEETSQKSMLKAIELYKYALETKEDLAVQLNLAKCLMRTDRLVEVQELLLKVTRASPESSEARCLLADVFYQTNQRKQAMKVVDSLLLDFPDDKFGNFMKGKYLFEDNLLAEAIPFLKTSLIGIPLVQRPPPDQQALFKQHLEAVKAAQFGKVPNVVLNEEDQQEIQEQMDISKNSVASNRESILSADNPEAQIPSYVDEAADLLGRCLMDIQDYKGAYEYVAYTSSLLPDDVNMLIMKGDVLYKIGRTAEAIEAYQRVKFLNRNAIRPAFQLANLIADTGDHERALTYYNTVLELLEERKKHQKEMPETSPSDNNNHSNEDFEMIDSQELIELIHTLFCNMALCHSKLSKEDPSNSLKHKKMAKHFESQAEQVAKSLVGQVMEEESKKL